MDQLAERLQAMPPSRRPTPGQLNLVLKELFDSLLKDCERRRDLIGDGFNLLPNGNRQEIMNGTADPYTLEVCEDYKARGVFDGELPEEKAAFWQASAGNNVAMTKLIWLTDRHLVAPGR